jgi:hypothetical protein
MKFQPGQSGNPSGYKKGQPNKITAAIRQLVNAEGPEIVRKVIEDAKNGDVAARQLFCKHLLPRYRTVMTPIDIEPAKDSDEARAQINTLVAMTAQGHLDLDSLRTLVGALRVSIDDRMAELDSIVRDLAERDGEREP